MSVGSSTTALQAGLTLADTLPQSEVFITIRSIPSEAWFSDYAKIKAIPPVFLNQGWEPATRVIIWYGPHRNFRYPISSTKPGQKEVPWQADT